MFATVDGSEDNAEVSIAPNDALNHAVCVRSHEMPAARPSGPDMPHHAASLAQHHQCVMLHQCAVDRQCSGL